MPTPRMHRAWIVAGATFVTLLGAAGFRAAPGILIDPLHGEFGWSRATISAAISVNLVLYGVIGPFAAALMNRIGLRTVVAGALVLVSAGAVLTTSMTEPWQLILAWGVLVGLGSGCMATVLAATVATRWFVARRGLVVGALTAASATGQLVFLPVLGSLAAHQGWRTVSWVIGIAALCVLPVVVLLLRDRPSDVGLAPYGAPPGLVEVAEARGNPVRAAFGGLVAARRSLPFWLLFGSFFVCGASTNGLLGAHFIPAAHDHGISEQAAAGVLALVGVFDVIGTMASGWLTDRVDPRRLLLVYYGFRGLSLFALDGALASGHAPLWVFIVFYGLDWVATVPPTVALCNEVFGEQGTVVYGWVFAGHQLGAAVAAWVAGYTRDLTGSYRLAFLGAGVLCLTAAGATQAIARIRRQVAATATV